MVKLFYALMASIIILGCKTSNLKLSNILTDNSQIYTKNEEPKDTLNFACNIQLTYDEQTLNNKLNNLRFDIIQKSKEKHLPLFNSSLTELKPFIESSQLFRLLNSMPKGGLLHSHSGGILNPDSIINIALKFKDSYVYTGTETKDYIKGQLAIFLNKTQPIGFTALSDYLQKEKDAKEILKKQLTLNRATLVEYLDYWIEFEKRFKRINLLLQYRPFFKEYYATSFNVLLKDNIQHLEIRYIFGNLFDELNNNYSSDTTIHDLNDIVLHIQKRNPKFTLKLIYTSFKFLDSIEVKHQLKNAFELKLKYPNYISGFDLVADEATGNNIAYFKSTLKTITTLENQYGIKMPLYMHAGESNNLSNTNLLNLPLDLNKRIGHGLNLIYFPALMNQIKSRNNLVEISPLSNQELGYVSDLRNHPARVLMANGIQCSINSDDPGVFGYDGLSYDFWVAFMAWDLELTGLKKLVLNSINYSSLKNEERKVALIHLQNDWNKFVSDSNKK
ncbi:MAG: adenosine kinase [Chitinophagaceae bacterium BSSC1]|nr:MAG: adenosine kinase [Chitinophagaceae bacterium BSSC1]